MDNTAQSSNQDQTQVVPQVAPSVAPQVAPVTPVSVPQKEAGPAFSKTVQQEDYIRPSEVEPIIHPEVSEHGVEAVSDHESLQLTDEHKKIGIESAKESTPVATQPTGRVQLPMTEEEAKQAVKIHKKVSDSIVWLAQLILKHAKMAHDVFK